MNVRRVRSIKRVLAEHSSDELRAMLEDQCRRLYAADSRAAALELLEDRARGIGQEPSPDNHLRNQILLVGWYYYVAAIAWFSAVVVYTPVGDYGSFALFMLLPAAGFWWLGFALRQFSPTARTVATFISLLILPAVPLGTIIGIYCLDRLSRTGHLFGLNTEH